MGGIGLLEVVDLESVDVWWLYAGMVAKKEGFGWKEAREG